MALLCGKSNARRVRASVRRHSALPRKKKNESGPLRTPTKDGRGKPKRNQLMARLTVFLCWPITSQRPGKEPDRSRYTRRRKNSGPAGAVVTGDNNKPRAG